MLKIDALLATVGVETPAAAEKISGSLEEFYQLQKDLVFNLIDVMGLRLSRGEREAIQRIPTKNLPAFMAWCRGLDEEDRGNWQGAQEQFRAAVSAIPLFSPPSTPSGAARPSPLSRPGRRRLRRRCWPKRAGGMTGGRARAALRRRCSGPVSQRG